MCMKPAHTLNTWKARTWAQVAQAVTWDDYALNSDGKVTVKATRGPVIVWGRRSGEGEDVPRLEAPTPSPLEVEAARVNLKAHALAFVRCAQGRRKTKGGKRVGFLCLWRGGSRKGLKLWKREMLRDLDYLGRVIQRKARGLIGAIGTKPKVGPQWKKAVRRAFARDRKVDILSRLYPSPMGNWDTGGIDQDALRMLKTARDTLRQGRVPYNAGEMIEGAALALILMGYRKEARTLFAARARQAVTLALALRFLEAAAYRAHIARRVRPVSRRARVPRPLYARPRPPTCPLAPPVA